jgi:DNA-directed RNA polymerase subunit E'/Rpb7
MNIYTENILKTKIKISSKDLNKNFEENILNKLEKDLYNGYTKFGIIKKNSIKILKSSLGKLEVNGFMGNILYEVVFSCLICNPIILSKFICKVINVNNFGILAKIINDDEVIDIVEIIIPKKTASILSDIDLNTININDKILIQIIGKRPELNDKVIKCIAKVIKKINNTKEDFKELDNTIIKEEDIGNLFEEEQDDDDDTEEFFDDEIDETLNNVRNKDKTKNEDNDDELDEQINEDEDDDNEDDNDNNEDDDNDEDDEDDEDDNDK